MHRGNLNDDKKGVVSNKLGELLELGGTLLGEVSSSNTQMLEEETRKRLSAWMIDFYLNANLEIIATPNTALALQSLDECDSDVDIDDDDDEIYDNRLRRNNDIRKMSNQLIPGSSRNVLEIQLNPQELLLSEEKWSIGKAQRCLYLNIARVLTCLQISIEMLRKKIDKRVLASSFQKYTEDLLCLWGNCVKLIPVNEDNVFLQDMKKFVRSLEAWKIYTKCSSKELLKKMNNSIPLFWLNDQGETPAIKVFFKESGYDERGHPFDTAVVGEVKPLRDRMRHNQNNSAGDYRFGRLLFFGGMTIIGAGSKYSFSKKAKTKEAKEQETLTYYRKLFDDASDLLPEERRGVKRILLDFRGEEFYRGPEASGRKITHDALSRDNADMDVLSVPFVELFPGQGSRLPEMNSLTKVWSDPVLRLIKKHIVDENRLNDEEVDLSNSLLEHNFLACVRLWRGISAKSSEQTKEVRCFTLYERIRDLAKVAQKESGFISELAVLLITMLRYHFQHHDEWRYIDAWMGAEKAGEEPKTLAQLQDVPVPARYSDKHLWAVGAKWAAGLTLAVFLIVAMVSTSLIAPALIVLLPIAALLVGIFSWRSAKIPLPEPLYNNSDDAASQYYTALIAPARYSGMMVAAFVTAMKSKLGEKVLIAGHCKSAKDRFSRWLYLLRYRMLCQEIKEAQKADQVTLDFIQTKQKEFVLMTHLLREQLKVYAGVGGIMTTVPAPNYLIPRPGGKSGRLGSSLVFAKSGARTSAREEKEYSPYGRLFETLERKGKGLEAAVYGKPEMYDNWVGAKGRDQC